MPKIKTIRGIENRKVVSQKEWLAARKKLLVKEKKFSKLRDEMNLQRRKLPWVKVEKEYVFDGPTGKVKLAPLTEIEPFKNGMGWQFKWLSSFKTDFNFDFNVSFTPEQVRSGVLPYNYGKIRMKIEEREGASAFYRDKNGDIYHTYSTYARGIDLMNTTYNFLDLTAKGRDENPEASQDWVRYHGHYKGTAGD